MINNNPRKRIGQEGFTLVELMIVVAIIGILAVLAIFGVGKYVSNAKSAEARNALGIIAKAAVGASEQERSSGVVPATAGALVAGVTKGLCQSATPVPATVPGNQKYQSSLADWGGTALVGWQCLKFQMTEPQAFQYGYVSDSAAATRGTGFGAYGQSDFQNAGAATLSFEIKGAYRGQQLVVAPAMDEINGPATATPGS